MMIRQGRMQQGQDEGEKGRAGRKHGFFLGGEGGGGKDFLSNRNGDKTKLQEGAKKGRAEGNNRQRDEAACRGGREKRRAGTWGPQERKGP